MVKEKRSLLILFLLLMFFSSIGISIPAKATSAMEVSSKKVMLKKSKKQKVKIILNSSSVKQCTILVVDDAILSCNCAESWEIDSSGRPFLYLTIKGKANGSTKIVIRDKNSSKKAVIKVTVSGFKSGEGLTKLKKFILSEPRGAENFNGKSYKMRCLAIDPSLLYVGYCKKNETYVFKYSLIEENTNVTVILNPKDLAHTFVKIEESGTDISGNDYSYTVSGTVNAAKYKHGDLFSYQVEESSYYDYFKARRRSYSSVEEEEIDPDSLDSYVKYAFSGAMIDFDKALKKNGLSMRAVGFKKYKF